MPSLKVTALDTFHAVGDAGPGPGYPVPGERRIRGISGFGSWGCLFRGRQTIGTIATVSIRGVRLPNIRPAENLLPATRCLREPAQAGSVYHTAVTWAE